MSHLACAEECDHPLNVAQRDRFAALAALFPGVPRSLANSSGIFLGSAWRHELCRPGVALYGVNPTPDLPSPVLPVVRLEAPLLQVHEVDEHGTVGYGATYPTRPGMRVATIPVGYADGLPRSAAPGWTPRLLDRNVPIAGRVSMDLTCLDVSDMPLEQLRVRGVTAELIVGPGAVERLASAAGTIGYEILTRLGRRFERVYVEPDEGDAGAAHA
jgi:alanine racemase